MSIELDHLFICTRVGAPEVDQLSALGLTEGQPNLHPDQGTACRRFFFRNAYLEFLWVEDEALAQSEPVRPLGLWQRWRYQQTRSSPFGLGLHPAPTANDAAELPFKAWPYRPSWLAPPLQIDVAENSVSTAEPLVFYSSCFARPDAYPSERRQPLEHSLGSKQVTGLRITLPYVSSLSETLLNVERAGIAEFVLSASHLAEVIFDGGEKGRTQDFRPVLPLSFRW
jgi:hypothetical protein